MESICCGSVPSDACGDPGVYELLCGRDPTTPPWEDWEDAHNIIAIPHYPHEQFADAQVLGLWAGVEAAVYQG